jgi:hypothetical protein
VPPWQNTTLNDPKLRDKLEYCMENGKSLVIVQVTACLIGSNNNWNVGVGERGFESTRDRMAPHLLFCTESLNDLKLMFNNG